MTTTRPYLPCREIITFLADYLDRALAPDVHAEFERHLAVCDSCVEYLASYRLTIQLSKAAETEPELRVEDVPSDLIAAILASVSHDSGAGH